jgi:hypothetical protein
MLGLSLRVLAELRRRVRAYAGSIIRAAGCRAAD